MSEPFVPYLVADTVDDLTRHGLEAIQAHGTDITPSKGACREITGVTLELRHPLARISQSEARGKMISALGELCWYLSGSDDATVMNYYISGYDRNADNGVNVHGAYGPRLFPTSGTGAFATVQNLLKRKPGSRQAVMQIFSMRDIEDYHKDVPCTCFLQFLVRDSRLHLIVSMRSNDIIKGLPHDIFAFTMLQEIMARSLNLELGWYKHNVGSFHLYSKQPDLQLAQQFLDEGFQSTTGRMPSMPPGDPWPSIRHLLQAEAEVRQGFRLSVDLTTLDPYWADLIHILRAYKFSKLGNQTGVEEALNSLSNNFYAPFIIMRR